MNRKRTASLIAFFILLIAARLLQDTNHGSSYSPKAYGSRALLLLLQELGQPADVWRKPFDEITHSGTLVVIDPPQKPFFGKLHDWVSSGNTLVTFGATRATLSHFSTRLEDEQEADESEESDPSEIDQDESSSTSNEISLSKRLGNLATYATDSVRLTCAASYADFCKGIAEVSAFPIVLTEEQEQEVEILAYADLAPALIRIPVGQGEVFNVPSTELILNRNIDRFDNLRFAYQVITSSSKGENSPWSKILFDEFHHGFVEPGSGDAKHRSNALWLFVALFVAILVLAALSRAIRFGPPLPEAPRPPAGTAELAKALGLLAYQRQTVSMLPQYLTSWRTRLEKKYQVSARIDAQQLSEQLKTRGLISEEERPLLTQALEKLSQPAELDQFSAAHYVADLEDLLGDIRK